MHFTLFTGFTNLVSFYYINFKYCVLFTPTHPIVPVFIDIWRISFSCFQIFEGEGFFQGFQG